MSKVYSSLVPFILFPVFAGIWADLSAQKPEYQYYRWDAVAPQITGGDGNSPRLCAETRILEYIGTSIFVLIHRTVYYPNLKAAAQHRSEAFPGRPVKLQARLWDSSGHLNPAQQSDLVQIDSAGGRLYFGGRMPGAALEYLLVTEMPAAAYLTQWYPLPSNRATKLILVHPPELLLQYEVRQMQATSERQNRDEKVFTTLQMRRVHDSLSAVQPCVRVIMRKNTAGVLPGWEDAARNVLRMLEHQVSKKQQKTNRKLCRRVGRSSADAQGAALLRMMRQEHIAYNHALMHALLNCRGTEHELVWTTDRFHAPADSAFPYLPDMTSMYLYLSESNLWISAAGQLSKEVSDPDAGCLALFIPVEHPELLRWQSLPLPAELKHRDVAELVLTGDTVLQFRRQFKGLYAAIFRQYGELSENYRAETDVSVCRDMLPGAWLLACNTSRSLEGETVFNGICAKPGMIVRNDSVIRVNLQSLLYPPAKLDAVPGTLWERILRIPLPQNFQPEPDMIRDTVINNETQGWKLRFRTRKDESWIYVQLRLEVSGRCEADIIETGSFWLPESINLRKSAR